MHAHSITSRFSLRHHWLVRIAAALLAIAAVAAIPNRAQAGVYVSVNIAPPALPVYVQPAIPGPGYIWTPGYWAWDGYEYYWVPGTWVLAPFVGALWTPGYWGWSGGLYVFHVGYWGRHVGFYGGINYGYGYGGHGYDGGYWGGNRFYYNRSVNRVTNNITNVYNKTVINNNTIVNRTSYNGGPHGIAARATPQQQAWARDRRSGPVAAQLQQREQASRMPSQRDSQNHGQPPVAATPRAGAFNGRGVATAHGAAPAPMAARENRYAPQPATAAQRPGALRSAGFAPHANAGMPSNSGNRYEPSSANRGTARPDAYSAPRNRAPTGEASASRGYRDNTYRPQGQAQQAYRPAPRNEQPAYRPAPRNEQMPYRQANPRPAQYGRAAPQGHPAPAAHEERRDDKHH